MKSEKEILIWIHDNLGESIRFLTDIKYKDRIYTEALIAGLICRETGFLILRFANKGMDKIEIAKRMKGDYSKRQGESSARYHGFGFVQIDINSYPEFINNTPLEDYPGYLEKAIQVLEEKRASIENA